MQFLGGIFRWDIVAVVGDPLFIHPFVELAAVGRARAGRQRRQGEQQNRARDPNKILQKRFPSGADAIVRGGPALF
jgi:hypothetical protein